MSTGVEDISCECSTRDVLFHVLRLAPVKPSEKVCLQDGPQVWM